VIFWNSSSQCTTISFVSILILAYCSSSLILSSYDLCIPT
jgi:hypothetical protein